MNVAEHLFGDCDPLSFHVGIDDVKVVGVQQLLRPARPWLSLELVPPGFQIPLAETKHALGARIAFAIDSMVEAIRQSSQLNRGVISRDGDR